MFRYHASCTQPISKTRADRWRLALGQMLKKLQGAGGYERLSTESVDDGPGSEMDGSPDSDG